MTDYQTVNDEERSEQDQTFLDGDEQTTETQATDQEQSQEQEQPNTPKQAWDLALAQMTAEEARDYQQRTAQALAAGFPIPPPPGYDEPAPARADAQARAEQEAQAAKELQSQIAEAERTGDWNRAGILKGQFLNLARQQGNREQNTYGWQGPAA